MLPGQGRRCRNRTCQGRKLGKWRGEQMRNLFAAIVCVLLVSACSTRLGSFTVAATKNIGSTYKPLQTGVTGSDCSQVVLFIPWGSLNPNLQEAVDRAVEQVQGGDMMTNVVVTDDILFTFFYNRNCITV